MTRKAWKTSAVKINIKKAEEFIISHRFPLTSPFKGKKLTGVHIFISLSISTSPYVNCKNKKHTCNEQPT